MVSASPCDIFVNYRVLMTFLKGKKKLRLRGAK